MALAVADPSLADGFEAVYDREVVMDVRRVSRDDEAGEIQPVRVKILALDAVDAVRVEVSSEVNLFWHFTATIDVVTFRDMARSQRLIVGFVDFAEVLIRMLNDVIDRPEEFMALLYVESSGSARLDLVQNIQYKFVELLSLDLVQSSRERTRRHITFSYMVMRERVALLDDKLKALTRFVKTKHPALLRQFNKEQKSNTRDRTDRE